MKRAISIVLSLLLATELYAGELKLPKVLYPTDQQNSTLPEGKFTRVGPTIQIAILLDSSSSMDGLISQAKEQIWNIVNEVSRANRNNKDITMQVALYEYGKSTLPASTGYIKMLSPLTNDLDFLSEKLFSIKTQGGSEYAGEVISKAQKFLYWSSHPDDLRIIIIAGNEGFNQGHIAYKDSIARAKKKNIIVNTIFCGDYKRGIDLMWRDGANLGGGRYMNIDSDAKVVHVPTPYDDQIIALNRKLNSTYIGYGVNGVKYKKRQMAEDQKSRGLSVGSYISRAVSKSTKLYKTDSWDAVSSYEKGDRRIAHKIKETNVKFKDKSEDEINQIIQKSSKDREKIKGDIQSLEKKRRAYIQKNPPKTDMTFGDRIIKEIKEQMIESGFSFSSE